MKMLKPIIVVLLVLLIVSLASVATAQPRAGDALDLTMVLLPEGARSSQPITRRIELPPVDAAVRARAAEENREASERGQDPSSTARERAARGQETAGEARELGRQFGEQMSEQARQNRENVGRGSPPVPPPGGPGIELPGGAGVGPPDRPSPPDRPDPPGPPAQ